MSPELQPGQNSWGAPATTGQVTGQQQRVLRNTYLLLALSLIPTGIGALMGINLTLASCARAPSFRRSSARSHLRHVLCDRKDATAAQAWPCC